MLFICDDRGKALSDVTLSHFLNSSSFSAADISVTVPFLTFSVSHRTNLVTATPSFMWALSIFSVSIGFLSLS